MKMTPNTPTIEEAPRAASDLSMQSGSRPAAQIRIEACREASAPVAPAVTATDEKVSPRMIAYATHTPRVSAASEAGTIHAERSPMEALHASPRDVALLASHMRAVSENEYAEMRPSPRMREDAGTSAAGTSPILATPAGSARTPAPSAALQVLKIVVTMPLCSASDAEADAPPGGCSCSPESYAPTTPSPLQCGKLGRAKTARGRRSSAPAG